MALELPIKPNEAQQEALNALNESRKAGKNKGLVVMATGTGKTITAALDTLQAESKSILFIVHRNEINFQAVEEFSRVRGKGESIGFVNADLKEFDKPIIFGTVQTLSRPDNLKALESKQFDYFIIDEAHHVAALSYQRIIKAVKATFTLGLTATPERLKEGHVKQFFDDNVVFELGLKSAIDKKILVPFIYYGLHDNIDYSDIKWNGYKYSEKDLDKKLIIDKRNEAIVKEFQDHASTRQTIGFCVNIRHANIMANKFNRLGIKAVAITNKTPKDKRAKIIEAFRKREIQVIFTRDIFNEGVDFPNVEALLFLRPTFSQIVFYQQLGRGLRKAEGKNNVLVLDFIGNEHNASRKVAWLKKVGIPISLEKERAKPKPEYEHYTPQVWFDSKVIDIFDSAANVQVTDEALLSELKRLNVGHPKINIHIVDKFGRFHSSRYIRRFGSFNNALEKASMPINNNHYSNIETEFLLSELRRLSTEHIKVTSRIVDQYGKYGVYAYKKVFGSFNNALKLAGIKQNVTRRSNITNEELLKELSRLQSEYKQLSIDIIKKHCGFSAKIYQGRFGSLNNALKLIGIPSLLVYQRRYTRIPDKEFLDYLHEFVREHGRVTKQLLQECGKYKFTPYRHRFGSLNNALKLAGLEPNPHGRRSTKKF